MWICLPQHCTNTAAQLVKYAVSTWAWLLQQGQQLLVQPVELAGRPVSQAVDRLVWVADRRAQQQACRQRGAARVAGMALVLQQGIMLSWGADLHCLQTRGV